MRIRPLVWTSIVLVLVALVLAGCGRSTPPTTEVTPDQSTNQTADVTTEPSDTSPSSDTTPDSNQTADDADVFAYVNLTPITNEAFERFKQQVLYQYQQLYAQFGQDVTTLLQGARGRVFDLRLDVQALNSATARTLITQELAKRDASVTDDAVDAEFQPQYQQYLTSIGMTEDELKDSFDAGQVAGSSTGGMTFDQFISYARQTVREQLELDALQHEIADPVEYTDDDLTSYFNDHQDDYKQEEQVRASHILVDTEDLANQIHDQLENGADFAELAKQYSTDTGSASNGGDLGWFSRGQMVQAFEDAAFSTPVGEISDVVQTQYGYHIIKVTDHRDASTPTFDDVKDQVAQDYQASVRSQKFQDWYQQVQPEAQVTITDPVLAAYQLAQTDPEQGVQDLIQLRDDGTTDEKYLNYIIGSVYESMMDNAQSQQQTLKSNDTITDEQQQQIDDLTTQIATLRAEAIAAYQAQQAALDALGEQDDDIQSDIDALQQAVEPTTVQTPDTTVEPAPDETSDSSE